MTSSRLISQKMQKSERINSEVQIDSTHHSLANFRTAMSVDWTGGGERHSSNCKRCALWRDVTRSFTKNVCNSLPRLFLLAQAKKSKSETSDVVIYCYLPEDVSTLPSRLKFEASWGSLRWSRHRASAVIVQSTSIVHRIRYCVQPSFFSHRTHYFCPWLRTLTAIYRYV